MLLFTVEHNWSQFKNKLSFLARKHVPLGNIKTDGHNPWFTKAIRRIGNKKKRLFNKVKLSPANKEARNKYEECENLYRQEIAKSKSKFYENDLLKVLSDNPKQFWNIINPNLSPLSLSLTSRDSL